MSIQALQQTGHANNGFPEFSAHARVSRLLSLVVSRQRGPKPFVAVLCK
jgi:hypothetical protein